MQTQCYKVFTKRLANILCEQGFKVERTEINNQKPWLYVYLFEDSKELRQAIQEFLNKEALKNDRTTKK